MNSTLPETVRAFLIAESIISVICVITVVITLPIYTTTVIILIQGYFQPGFSNSFYRLCMMGGMVDTLALLHNYLLGILPARGYFHGLFLSSSRVGAAYLAISWGIRYSQNITAFLLAVNRLTTLMRATNLRSSPLDGGSFLTHAIQIIPGLAVGALLYTTRFYYEESGLGGVYTMFGDDDFKRIFYTISGSIGSLFALSMILIYSIAWILFRRLKSGLSSGKKLEMQRQDNRLLYVSFCICTIEIICFIFTAVTFLFKFDPSGVVDIKPVRFFYLFYNLNVVFYSSSPPFLLLAFSTPFRRRFVQLTRLDRLRITRWSHFISSITSLSTPSMNSMAR